MPPLFVSCSRCGATNEPGGERCYRCGQPFSTQMLLGPSEQPRRGMSRRAALLTLMGIGIVAVPVSAGVGYLAYLKLTDPHIVTYSGQGTTTSDAAWSPDSTRVASSGWLDGGTVQIWNATTGKTLQTCRANHPGPAMVPLDVIWSADGRNVLAFVGSNDTTPILTAGSRIVEMVQVWDATTGQQVRSIPVMEPVTVNAQGTGTDRPLVQNWALNERYLAAVNAQDQGSLKIWEIATGANIATLSAESQQPTSKARMIGWAPDNEKLAIQWLAQAPAGQLFQTIEIWNIATLNKIASLNTIRHDYATSLTWSPDSKMLVLGFGFEAGALRTYEIWDVLAGKKAQTLQTEAGGISLISWSPNGKYLALENEVYSVETGNRITAYPPAQGMVTSLAWSPDSTRMALVDSVKHGTGFSSTSSTLYILDALSGRQRAGYAGGGLFGNSGTSGKLAWSPDGKYVMVVGQQVDIWKGA